MATTQTFGGGVHPREIGNGKSATQSQQIVNAAAPARVTIAMAQHGGAPAVCCVKVGQIVNMGQMIGEAQGFISCSRYMRLFPARLWRLPPAPLRAARAFPLS